MASRPKRRKLARRPKAQASTNWPKIRTKFKAVMNDVRKEVGRSWTYTSRKVERGLEAKLLPSLKRARRKLEGLIAQLDKRTV